MHDDLQTAQNSGLSIPAAAPSAPATKGPPKFRNTENPDQTWMGRGKRPNWLKAQLAAGRNLEDFRIND